MQQLRNTRHLEAMAFAVASGLVFLAATGLAAAQALHGIPASEGLAEAAHRITIDVAVTDKQGHHARGLQARDFTLLDSKQPLKLLSFRAVSPTVSPVSPLHVVIVIDNINSTFSTVSREREQLGEFLKQNNGQLAHATSIAVLADTGIKIESGSSADGNALLAGFGKINSELRIVGDDTGFYGATERLEMSLSQLSELASYEATQPGRKLMLVVSPGWPMLDWVGIQADMHERAWIFKSVVGLTNGLREAHITLYSLEPFELGRVDPFYYEDYLKGVSKVEQADYPDLSLQVLAAHSGGLVLVTGNSITEEINSAIRDANSYYELTFESGDDNQPDEYHALTVKIDKPGLAARTTAGYYTDTGQQAGATSRKSL
ncbi:MAG: VWA domain-containing protein [Acidobacteriota bacterium]|nr:VWA domain-containing protein [Acidobacteriota bacterium]